MIDPLDRFAELIPPPMPTELPARVQAVVLREQTRLLRRKKMLRRLSLVACLVLIGSTAIAFWPSTSAAQAIAAAVRKSSGMKGFKSTTKEQVETAEGKLTPRESTYLSNGSQTRHEVGDVTTIRDYAIGIRLILNASTKTAERQILSPTEIQANRGSNYALPETFRWQLENVPQLFEGRPDGEVDGRRMKVYSMKLPGKSWSATVYIDHETGLIRREVGTDSDRNGVLDMTYFNTSPIRNCSISRCRRVTPWSNRPRSRRRPKPTSSTSKPSSASAA